jgi:hypothetical protein
LDFTSVREICDLAEDAQWRADTRAAVAAAADASGLEAEMRDLLLPALANLDATIPLEWQHRVHRALCEWDGIVRSGQDIEWQYRERLRDGQWNEWRRTPEGGVPEVPGRQEVEYRLRPRRNRLLECAGGLPTG